MVKAEGKFEGTAGAVYRGFRQTAIEPLLFHQSRYGRATAALACITVLPS